MDHDKRTDAKHPGRNRHHPYGRYDGVGRQPTEARTTSTSGNADTATQSTTDDACRRGGDSGQPIANCASDPSVSTPSTQANGSRRATAHGEVPPPTGAKASTEADPDTVSGRSCAGIDAEDAKDHAEQDIQSKCEQANTDAEQ